VREKDITFFLSALHTFSWIRKSICVKSPIHFECRRLGGIKRNIILDE